jgi:hypothetical protein
MWVCVDGHGWLDLGMALAKLGMTQLGTTLY